MGLQAPGGPGHILFKGAACQCLDVLHTNTAQMDALELALQNARPAFSGLGTILERNLLNLKYSGAALDKIVAHLNDRWFWSGTDPVRQKSLYFPQYLVAPLYGQGLLKTIEASKKTTPRLPINAIWLSGHAGFEMIVGYDLTQVSPEVSLIIATPRAGPYP